jgi:hypothetical protein
MRATKLIVKNVGTIVDETITLDKPLILFYGEIRQGKTTLLNAVRWVCGGEWPTDIIRHGHKEAMIELQFAGGSISRRWYIGQDGTTKADEIIFIRDGKKVARPVAEIRRFLNPFLIDQDHLRNMGETDRKKYFAELFAVDTTALDGELLRSQSEARELRAKIKGYGNIDLTEVKPIDVEELKQQKAKAKSAHFDKIEKARVELRAIQSKNDAERQAVVSANWGIKEHNKGVAQIIGSQTDLVNAINELEAKLNGLRGTHARNAAWLKENPPKHEMPMPAERDTSALEAIVAEQVDTSEIDGRIAEASATNVRAEQYRRNKEHAEQRASDAKALAELEARQRQIGVEKTAKLKEISDKCGIPDLAFDESGNFIYQGTDAGMLSTSQIMKLSSELSALYPEGLGVELLDRGESLGKSIFGFIDRAKAEQKTILATIVGEKPAEIPADVGVFVVENGKLF